MPEQMARPVCLPAADSCASVRCARRGDRRDDRRDDAHRARGRESGGMPLRAFGVGVREAAPQLWRKLRDVKVGLG